MLFFRCLGDDSCLSYQYEQKEKENGKCILIYKGCVDNFESDESVVTYIKHKLNPGI